jgi:hypothetical protein
MCLSGSVLRPRLPSTSFVFFILCVCHDLTFSKSEGCAGRIWAEVDVTGRARKDVKEKSRNMDKKKLGSSMEKEQEGPPS